MPRQLRHARRFAWWMTNFSKSRPTRKRRRQHSCSRKSAISQIGTSLTLPHPLEHRLIFKNIGREGYTTDIDCYLQNGGYEQLKRPSR